MAKKIETRKDEIRYKTIEPSQMLNKYICKRVVKKWTEEFTDEDTGEKVNVERSQTLYERGTVINKETLARIQFDIEAGEITEPIEVSNQNRTGYEFENESLFPWAAKVAVEERNVKFLLYGSSIDNALTVLRDYVELHYNGGFTILEAKEFNKCIILTDRLSDKMKGSDIDAEYLKGNIDFETYIETREKDTSDIDGESKDEGKKFYQLELTIQWKKKDDEEGEYNAEFVVHTFDVDRALLIINAYLVATEAKRKMERAEKNEEYLERTFHLLIEKAAPIPVGRYIPKEFSLAYQSE